MSKSKMIQVKSTVVASCNTCGEVNLSSMKPGQFVRAHIASHGHVVTVRREKRTTYGPKHIGAKAAKA